MQIFDKREKIICLIVLLCCVTAGVFVLRSLTLTTQAETNTDAFRAVCRSITEFINTNNEWPQSEKAFADFVASRGGFDTRWEQDFDITERVHIRFGVPLGDCDIRQSGLFIGDELVLSHSKPIYEANKNSGYKEVFEAIQESTAIR